MRLNFSSSLLIAFSLTAGVVSLSDAVACSCGKPVTSNSDAQTEGDRVALESEVFLKPSRFQSLRGGGEVPDGMVPILYGYPTPEAMEAAKRGEIILGGCIVSPGQPQFGLLPDLVEGEIN